MAEISFNLPNTIATKLSNLSLKENCSIDTLLIEAITHHFNITIDDEIGNDGIIIEHPYYVYVYLNPLIAGPFIYGEHTFNYMPIYVGKGYGERDTSHLSYAKNTTLSEVLAVIEKENLRPIVIRIADKLTSHQAYMTESKLIYEIGRVDLQKGPLLNKSSGIHYNPNTSPSTILEDSNMLLIISALNNHKTIRDAALSLGVSERTLYRKLKSTNIKKVNKKYIIL
jgi:hypothetical protein